MKIGILTFHNALNYGAVLQTYASVQFLRSLGHQASVVDYRNPFISRVYHPLHFEVKRFEEEGLKYVLKYPYKVLVRMRKAAAFKRFVKRYLPLCSCAEAETMDLLLVGSDQVWSKRQTDGKDPAYYGELFPTVPKVAWAASADRTLPDATDIRELMKNFTAISVREQVLADRIPGSTVLPDPTMMPDEAAWRPLVRPVKGRYLLAFPMKHEREVMKKARKLAQEKGLELKVLSPYIKTGSRWIQTASPEMFLSLFHSAEYVVTSSFHGAVFTLLFDRPHTFVFHEDPRFDTLLQTDRNLAAGKAKAFLEEAFRQAAH